MAVSTLLHPHPSNTDNAVRVAGYGSLCSYLSCWALLIVLLCCRIFPAHPISTDADPSRSRCMPSALRPSARIGECFVCTYVPHLYLVALSDCLPAVSFSFPVLLGRWTPPIVLSPSLTYRLRHHPSDLDRLLPRHSCARLPPANATLCRLLLPYCSSLAIPQLSTVPSVALVRYRIHPISTNVAGVPAHTSDSASFGKFLRCMHVQARPPTPCSHPSTSPMHLRTPLPVYGPPAAIVRSALRHFRDAWMMDAAFRTAALPLFPRFPICQLCPRRSYAAHPPLAPER